MNIKPTKNKTDYQIRPIPIAKLQPSGFQPRTIFSPESLDELATSIRQHGILQPLLVQKKDAKYEIIAGERRFRAAQRAELKLVPCIEVNFLPEESFVVALVENLQREDLNPLEEAHAFLRLQEQLSLSQEEIARRVGKDRVTITNSLRLLRLPQEIQEMVSAQSLSPGHARSLLSLKSPDMMVMVAQKIIREGMSVRSVESLVRSLLRANAMANKPATPEHQALLRELRSKLEYLFGSQVSLQKQGDGYTVTILCPTKEDFNGFLERFDIKI